MARRTVESFQRLQLKLNVRKEKLGAEDLTLRVSDFVNRQIEEGGILGSFPKIWITNGDILEFHTKMIWIYDNIRKNWIKELTEQGTKLECPQVMRWAYVVAYRYGTDFTNSIHDFSEDVSHRLPSLVYSLDNIHTTVVTSDLEDNFSPSSEKLQELSRAIKSIQNNLLRCSINFWKPLYNPTAWIIPWIPWKNFLENLAKIQEAISKTNLWMKIIPPWGAHITISRFTSEESSKKVIECWLIDVIESTPEFWRRIPTWIDIWYFTYDTTGFVFTPMTSIEF